MSLSSPGKARKRDVRTSSLYVLSLGYFAKNYVRIGTVRDTIWNTIAPQPIKEWHAWLPGFRYWPRGTPLQNG